MNTPYIYIERRARKAVSSCSHTVFFNFSFLSSILSLDLISSIATFGVENTDYPKAGKAISILKNLRSLKTEQATISCHSDRLTFTEAVCFSVIRC